MKLIDNMEDFKEEFEQKRKVVMVHSIIIILLLPILVLLNNPCTNEGSFDFSEVGYGSFVKTTNTVDVLNHKGIKKGTVTEGSCGLVAGLKGDGEFYEVDFLGEPKGYISKSDLIQQDFNFSYGIVVLLVIVLFVFLSLLFFTGGYIYLDKSLKIYRKNLDRYHNNIETKKSKTTKPDEWSALKSEASNSTEENDWVRIIIKADSLLEKRLREKGVVGENLGEMLKTLKDSLPSIQYAWDVHKIRNSLAHAEIGFIFDKRKFAESLEKFEILFQEIEKL